MRTKNIHLLVLIISLIDLFIYTNVKAQSFASPETGNQSHVVCKYVEFDAGYEYDAQSGLTMNAYIDPSILCDVEPLATELSGQNPKPDLDRSLEVGTTVGAFSVSPVGAATYTIPLISPPGTMGMVPEISVNYNSGAPDGIMGTGWGIGGFGISSITRTSQNTYYDGQVYPVTLGNDPNNNYGDRFMLDGSRLIATNGNYGDAGIIYATESESYARITSDGPSGNPSSFTVETKDGKIFEYGKRADSYIEPKGVSNVALTWLLNKVTDCNGNYMEIYYYENNNTGEFRVDHIDYTGNQAASISPINKIKFVYVNRSNDKQLYYVAGYPVKQEVLLSSIQMLSEGNLVRQYEFNYTDDPILGSHLSEVVEKGSDAKQYNSIKVGWSISANQSIPNPATNSGEFWLGSVPNSSYACIKYPGDFNGDGFTDLFVVHGKTPTDPGTDWELYINENGTGFPSAPITGQMPLGYHQALVGWEDQGRHAAIVDFNGDGSDDIIVPVINTTNGNNYDEFVVMISTPSGFSLSSPFHPAESTHALESNGDPDPHNGHYMLLGDFDGDGTTDIFLYYYDKDYWYIHSWNTGNTYSEHTDWGDATLSFNTVDFDGDGKSEILFTYAHSASSSYVKSLGPDGLLHIVSQGPYPTPSEGADRNIYPGDFNGDGKTDLLAYDSQNSAWHLYYAEIGTSLPSPLKYQSFSVPSDFPNFGNPAFNTTFAEVLIGDYNGDGKSDIAVYYHYWNFNTSTAVKFVKVFYSLGNNQFYREDINNLPTNNEAAGLSFIGDFNGDGRSDIFFANASNGNGEPLRGLYFHSCGDDGYPAISNDYNKVSSITNGFNETIFIDYNTLPELAIHNYYTSLAGSLLNMMNFQKSLSVVRKFSAGDGLGGLSTTEFSYVGAVMHLQGKGFLGFSQVNSKNSTTNLKTEDYYSLDYSYYLFKPNYSLVYDFAGVDLFSDKIFTYNITPITSNYSNSRFKIELAHLQTIDIAGTSVDIDNSFNNYGDIIYQLSTVGALGQAPISTTETTNSYSQSCGPTPSNLESSTVTVHRGQEPAISRTSHFSYDQYGRLIDEYRDYQLPKEVHTSLTYTPVGTIDKKTISASGLTSRDYSYEYDPQYRFVLKEHNNPTTIDQITETKYDSRWGVPISVRNVDGLSTFYTYDGFGRMTSALSPDNNLSSISGEWVQPNSMPSILDFVGNLQTGLYSITKSRIGRPAIKSYFDTFGREIVTESDGFSSKVYTQRGYDAKGNVTIDVGSHSAGQIFFPINSYSFSDDDKGYNLVRAAYKTDNDQVTNTTLLQYSHSGGNTTITQIAPDQKHTTKTTDPSGKLISATDNGGLGSIAYEYNSAGQIREIRVNNVVSESMTYEAPYGYQTSLTDRDAGTTSYIFDAYGQLASQTDANANNYTFDYNVLGQLTHKNGAEGTYSYSYFSAGNNGVNQIEQINGPNNINYSYSYDNLQRLKSITEDVDGQSFNTNYQYDRFGNISKTTYPGGFSTNCEYNQYGYATKIRNGSSEIWRGDEMNTLGQYSKFTLHPQSNPIQTQITFNNFGLPTDIYANGIQHLQLDYHLNNGTLLTRSDPTKNLSEAFSYDDLDRLLTVAGPEAISVGYDNTNGKREHKDDAGMFAVYNSNHLDALEQLTTVPNTSISIAPQVIVPTQFNKIQSVTEGLYTLQLTYGPDQQRKKSQLFNQNSLETTRYFHPCYEKTITGANTTEVYYINAPTGLCAMYVLENGAGTMYYVYSDQLGSILTLTDGNGNPQFEQSFDAWGRNRNPTNWRYPNVPAVPAWLCRGFTGHEHLPQFALINMNGRCYDPILGEMVSPDNYVQNSTSTKCFDRYSYCSNNPLKYVDKDGNWFVVDDAVAAAIGGVVNLGVNLFEGNVHNFWQGLGYFGAGAAAGDLALYGPLGWAAGGAILGSSNALLGGATGKQALVQGGIGVVSGLAGGAVGQWAQNGLGGIVVNGFKIGSPVLKGLIGGGIGGGFGGYVGGFTSGFLISGGDLKAANKMGVNSMVMGAGIGLGTGAVSGYAYAKANNLDPWTGKSTVTRYYRSVSAEELADIYKNGFRPNPNQEGYQEGKLFWTDRADAEWFNSHYDGNSVVEITVPNKAGIMPQPFPGMDGRQSAVFINIDDLPRMNDFLHLLQLKK